MDTFLIFTDAATSPQTSIAVGAFLCIKQSSIESYAQSSPDELYLKLSDIIVYGNYTSKKSTWSEIKTVIDALSNLKKNPLQKVELYTDCQSVCDLLNKRKEKLLKNNFITRTGKVLANADLYKELFEVAEQFDIHVFKIKGHSPKSNRVSIEEKIFTVLDKLSRKKLRSLML